MADASWNVDIKWEYFVVLLVFLLIIRSFKRLTLKVYRLVYAFIYSRVSVRRNRQYREKKESLFKDLTTVYAEMTRPLCVLEIGAGSGANFEYFPKGTNCMCLDPNPYFEKYLRKNCNRYPDINLQEFIVGRAEDLSILPNCCVDVVVCTWVLCSVSDVDLSLAEVKRVLRPVRKILI